MRLIVVMAVALALSSSARYAWSQAPTQKGRTGLALESIVAPWTGDLDGMVNRRMIRVLTAYSKTLYFIDRYKYHVTYLLIQGEYIQRRDLKKPGSP